MSCFRNTENYGSEEKRKTVTVCRECKIVQGTRSDRSPGVLCSAALRDHSRVYMEVNRTKSCGKIIVEE